MVKTGTDRSDKYTAKFDPEVIRTRYTATRDIANAKQVDMQGKLAIKNAAVRGFLNEAGILPIRSVEYQAFSNKLFGIVHKLGSGTINPAAIAVAQLQYVVWKGYGSTATVLQSIWGLYADTLGDAPSPL